MDFLASVGPKTPPPPPSKIVKSEPAPLVRRGPKKLTAEMITLAEGAFRSSQACTLYQAALAMGISKRTLQNWLDQAEQEGQDPLIYELAERVGRAQFRNVKDVGEIVIGHASEDARVATEIWKTINPDARAAAGGPAVQVNVGTTGPAGERQLLLKEMTDLEFATYTGIEDAVRARLAAKGVLNVQA